jgi:hypothetical protein
VVKGDLNKGQECHRSMMLSRWFDFLRLFEKMINLLVAASMLSESSLESIQFSMEAVLVADDSDSVCQGGKHRVHVGQIVVQCSIQINAGVGSLPKYCMTQEAIRFCVDINVINAIFLSFHGELDIAVNAIEVVQEVVKILWSMRLDHEHVINMSKSAEGLVVCSIECSFLKVLHKEVRNQR